MIAFKALCACEFSRSGTSRSEGDGMMNSVRMKLVFRLGGIGFALPVQDLVEIREDPGGVLDLSASEPSTPVVGHLMHRGETIPIHDLREALGLSPSPVAEGSIVLVLDGGTGAWAVTADRVEGIFPMEEFESRPLPLLLIRREPLPYTHLDLWRDEPLVLCEARRLEHCRGVA